MLSKTCTRYCYRITRRRRVAALLALLILLKIAGVSWLWVTLPLWIGPVLLVALLGLGVVLAGLGLAFLVFVFCVTVAVDLLK